MGRLLFFVIMIGAAIGMLVPTGEAPPPIQAARSAGRPPVPAETRVTRSGDGHFYVHATVNGQLVRFLVDTGASMVALTMDDARRVGAEFSPAAFEVVGSGASGPVRGQSIRLDHVTLDGKEVRAVRAAVLEGLGVSLLGQAYLARMRTVQMTGDEMIIR